MNRWSFRPYVSVAKRRANAAQEIKNLAKRGHKVHPVVLEGNAIARTFWGKAWCENLESYSDFANRLPRGRSYVRNGAVCDLQIEPGCVTAMVCGSELYRIKIGVKPLSPKAWSAIKAECAGKIGTVIELLQGKLSTSVMQIITRQNGGLFPRPAEIDLSCSCLDWAVICKHVASALYGVGARLDEQPELLFVLRQLNHIELIQQAGDVTRLTRRKGAAKTIPANALADVFGVDIEPASTNDLPPAKPRPHVPVKVPKRPSTKPHNPVKRLTQRGAAAEIISTVGIRPRMRRRTEKSPPLAAPF